MVDGRNPRRTAQRRARKEREKKERQEAEAEARAAGTEATRERQRRSTEFTRFPERFEFGEDPTTPGIPTNVEEERLRIDRERQQRRVALIQTQQRALEQATLSPEDIAAQEQARREAFQEQTGSAELAAGLQAQREAPPSLEPEGILGENLVRGAIEEEKNRIARLRRILLGKGSIGDLKTEANTILTRTGLGGALGLANQVFNTKGGAESVSGQAAKKTSSLGRLGKWVGAVGVYFAGREALDYRGGELDNMRSSLVKYTEDGEKIVALAKTTPDNVFTQLDILKQYVEEIDQAEATIKEIGNDNIQFRYEKEWQDDMQLIRTARTAVQRRVEEIENIAATGKGQLDPESLQIILATLD